MKKNRRRFQVEIGAWHIYHLLFDQKYKQYIKFEKNQKSACILYREVV